MASTDRRMWWSRTRNQETDTQEKCNMRRGEDVRKSVRREAEPKRGKYDKGFE